MMRYRKKNRNKRPLILMMIALALVAGAVLYWNPFGGEDGSIVEVHAAGGQAAAETGQAADTEKTAVNTGGAAVSQEKPPAGAKVLARAVGQQPFSNTAAVKALNNTKISVGSLFSLREWLNDGEAGSGNEDLQDWSYAASLLYEAAMKAGMEPVERHIGLELPAYASPGFEADVSGVQRDLKVYNVAEFDVWITVDVNGQQLEIRIVGEPGQNWEAPKLTVKVERFKPSAKVLVDFAQFGSYEEQLGKEGLLAKVFRTQDKEEKLLYKDFYEPIPHVTTRPPSQDTMEQLHTDGIVE